MASRDPQEAHRVATPLELLFDLCFVVAIAQLAARLHHGLSEGHFGHALAGYGLVFFAVWWAWMNFTWFASAYDVDDVAYRLLALLQMAGVLVLAAGVPRAFEQGNFGTITLGYSVMRVAQVSQWLRAAHGDDRRRRTALRYALGVALCQIGWIGLLWLPREQWVYGFCVLAPAELVVPVWAERTGSTPWHPHHIAERYGLLTLIVLGESVLSATQATQAAFDAAGSGARLLALAAGGLLTLFSMWWLYFEHPARLLGTSRATFAWGYGHLPIFASIAAVGAGLSVTADHAEGHAHVSTVESGLAVAVPVAVYLLVLWAVQLRPQRPSRAATVALFATVGLVLLAPAGPAAVLVIGVLLSALAAVVTLDRPIRRA
jgi:low temperature requirement protein LtrA